MLSYLRNGGEAEAMAQAGELTYFDFIELMVAADQQQPDLRRLVFFVYRKHDGFHRAVERQAQQLRHIFATRFARSGYARERLFGGGAVCNQWQCFGALDIGGVIVSVRYRNGIL